MKIADRLNELIAEAEAKELDISELEVWQPFGLMLAVGNLLGLTPEEVLAPVDQL